MSRIITSIGVIRFGILVAFSLAKWVFTGPLAAYSRRIRWETPGEPGETRLPESLFIVDNTEDYH